MELTYLAFNKSSHKEKMLDMLAIVGADNVFDFPLFVGFASLLYNLTILLYHYITISLYYYITI